jgi:hypothetical protein
LANTAFRIHDRGSLVHLAVTALPMARELSVLSLLLRTTSRKPRRAPLDKVSALFSQDFYVDHADTGGAMTFACNFTKIIQRPDLPSAFETR